VREGYRQTDRKRVESNRQTEKRDVEKGNERAREKRRKKGERMIQEQYRESLPRSKKMKKMNAAALTACCLFSLPAFFNFETLSQE
jgi:hypothetical protein